MKDENYYIVNRKVPFMRPLSIFDKNRNSQVIELPYDLALKYAEEMNKENQCDDFYCISVNEWIEKVNSPEYDNLNKKMRKFWDNINLDELLPDDIKLQKKEYEELHDKNINGFILPQEVGEDKDYLPTLEKIFSEYYNYIHNKKAFEEYNIDNDVKKITSDIIKAIKEYYLGNISNAQCIICEIIENCIKNDSTQFLLSELDKNYAFRGIAPFDNIRDMNVDYKKQAEYELSFFKARQGKVESRVNMVHIPLDSRGLISTQRFSIAGIPCIYLGVTSYVCWLELRKPTDSEFNVSAFKFNEDGKKLKILNLVISEALINGMGNLNENISYSKRLQSEMLKIWPLVCATSFRVNDESRKFKSEYIVSQLIMMNLKKLGIDGVAYLSKQVKDDFQYPFTVNLALPVCDINNSKYGDICNNFELTLPSNFSKYTKIMNSHIDKNSYINECYQNGFHSQVYFDNERIKYSDIVFSEFDNYLVSSDFSKYNT